MSLLDRLRTYATGQRSGRPESTEVKPTPPKALERMGEVSYNPNSLFSWWSANARIYNPQDDLIGRKSMDLYDQMRRDAQVKAAMALKKGAALSTGWEVVPATDKKKDKVPAEFVEWTLKHLDPLYGSFDDCLREILTALDYGFSVTEIVLKYLEEGPYKGKYGLRTLKTRRPHDFSFDVDAFDNLKADGLKQNWMGEPLPLDKFLLYVYQREFGNWKGLSDLRSAYAPWWMKDNVWRWVGIYAERFAIPIPVGKFPPGHPFPQEIADFRQMLSNIQANTSFTFPNSFELLLQEASGRGIDIFKWLIEESNMEITRSILVPNRLGVSSEPTTGSYSQARKHFDVFMLVVDDLRRDLAEDVIQVQLVNRLVDWNYTVEDPPKFKWLPFTSEEEAALFTLWLQAVTGKVVKPTFEDESHIRSVTGFPEREETEADKAQAEAAAKAPDPATLGPDGQPLPPQPTDPFGGGTGGGDTGGGGGGWSDWSAPAAGDTEYGSGAEYTKVPRAEIAKYVRAPTEFEKKIDFAHVERSLDDLQEMGTKRMQAILRRSTDAYLKTVAQKFEDGEMDTNVIPDLKLKFMGELLETARAIVSEAYQIGEAAGTSTLPKDYASVLGTDGVKPEKALAFFKAKADFTVKGLNNTLITASQNVLYNAIKTGQPLATTIGQLRAMYEPYLGDPNAIKPKQREQAMPYRLATIVRTNTTEAMAEGLKDAVEPAIKSGYVIGFQSSAILDDRVTEICQYLHGRFFRAEGEETALLTPPRHWNALASGTRILTEHGWRAIENVQVGERVLTHRHRWQPVYAWMGKRPDGPTIRELRLTSGRVLRVTDEHPILTTAGWKAAGNLKIGDVLFENSQQSQRMTDVLLPDPHDFPSLANEPSVSWEIASGPMRIMGLPVHLQNHARTGEGKIHGVATNRKLEDNLDATTREDTQEDRFVLAGALSGRGAPATNHALHNSRHCDRIRCRHALGVLPVGEAGSFAKSPRPMIGAARMVLSDGVGDLGLGDTRPHGNPMALTPRGQHGLPKTEGRFDMADRLPPLPVSHLNHSTHGRRIPQVHTPPLSVWSPAAIISIADVRYNQYVWNLAVEEDETYVAEGCIVHNCRSIMIPITKDEGPVKYITSAQIGKALGMMPAEFGGKQ